MRLLDNNLLCEKRVPCVAFFCSIATLIHRQSAKAIVWGRWPAYVDELFPGELGHMGAMARLFEV